MAPFIVALIVFIIADIIIRYVAKRVRDKKILLEREEVLKDSLNLDFSSEAKTLKRADVENPKAKILCVDDEEVILDGFRKILVLDGYSVDTVLNGKEAIGLILSRHYDFVFTDLKMPEMDGIEVSKAVKHMRPDIDVIIITGYATVESAVECMKYGAMDYVQKPFTEDELLDFVKTILIKRQDSIQKQLKPKVHITHLSDLEHFRTDEFAIPGGVFISEGHCWASIEQNGIVRIGMDDFAKKVIGRIDQIEFPNLGMTIQRGQSLFTIHQGTRKITFNSPVSGRIAQINSLLAKDLESLNANPYDRNWICAIDAENFDEEIKKLKIGKSAIAFYQDEIDRFRSSVGKITKSKEDMSQKQLSAELHLGEMENLNDKNWALIVTDFFFDVN